jgi:hypothetical protein
MQYLEQKTLPGAKNAKNLAINACNLAKAVL